MKNKIYFFAVAMLCLMTACNDDDNDKDIRIADNRQLNQTAYADSDDTGSGFTFTANRSWEATVSETTNSTQEAGTISWLKLTHNGEEITEGKEGTYSLKIETNSNYTGKNRTADIVIKSGNDKITIKVTQYAETKDGEIPEHDGEINGYDEEKLMQEFTYNKNSGSFTFTTSASWTSVLEIISGTEKNPTFINYSPSSGSEAGTYTIDFTLDENEEKQIRWVAITIYCGNDEVQLNIKQDAHPIDYGIETNSEFFNKWLVQQFDSNDDGKITEDEAELIEHISFPYSAGEKIEGNIDLSDFPNIITIDLKGHAIEYFTINSSTLERLTLSENKLKDLSGSYPNLSYLGISDNEISKINTSAWPSLGTLLCYNNPYLSSLDISGSPDLILLDCVNTPLLNSISVTAAQQSSYETYGENFIIKDSHTNFTVTN